MYRPTAPSLHCKQKNSTDLELNVIVPHLFIDGKTNFPRFTVLILLTMTRLILSLTLLCLAATSFAAGTTPPVLDLTVAAAGEDRVLAVRFNGLTQPGRVSILDKDNIALLQVTVAAGESYGKLLNLKALPAGSYRLSIDTDLFTTIQPFRIVGTFIDVTSNDRFTTYKPYVRYEENTVNLTYFGNGGKCRVTLSDGGGTTLLEDRQDGQIVVEQRYDLRSLPPGTYYLTVVTDHDMVSRKVVR